MDRHLEGIETIVPQRAIDGDITRLSPMSISFRLLDVTCLSCFRGATPNRSPNPNYTSMAFVCQRESEICRRNEVRVLASSPSVEDRELRVDVT